MAFSSLINIITGKTNKKQKQNNKCMIKPSLQPSNPLLPLYLLGPGGIKVKEVSNQTAIDFAVGSVLGDGHIQRGRHYLIIGNQSPTFTIWKRDLARSCGLMDSLKDRETTFNTGVFKEKPITVPITIKSQLEKNGPKDKVTGIPKEMFRRKCEFNTSALFHQEWRDAFYKAQPLVKGKKQTWRKAIPPNISELFTGNLALTIYFLDDGWATHKTISKQERLELACGEWPEDECKLMQLCLKDNFGVDTLLYPYGKSFKLRVETVSEKRFVECCHDTYCDLVQAYPTYRANKTMKNKYLFNERQKGSPTTFLCSNKDVVTCPIIEFWKEPKKGTSK